MIYFALYLVVNACIFLKLRPKIIEYINNEPDHYFEEDYIYSLFILITMSLGLVLYITAKIMKLIKWINK